MLIEDTVNMKKINIDNQTELFLKNPNWQEPSQLSICKAQEVELGNTEDNPSSDRSGLNPNSLD